MVRGRPFERGNKLGRGRPSLPPELHEIAALKNEHIKKLFTKFLSMTRDEIAEVLSCPNSPMLHVTLGRILQKTAQDGDPRRLEFLLSRVVGKVKDEVEVEVVRPFVIRRPNGDLELGATAGNHE